MCENRLTLDNSISRTNTSSSPRLKEQNQGEQVSETVLSENKFILDNSISRTIPESELPVKKLDTNYEASANENQQNRDTAVTEFYDDFESLLEVLRSSDENNVAASHCSAKEKDNDLSNVICSTRSSDTCIKNPKPSIVSKYLCLFYAIRLITLYGFVRYLFELLCTLHCLVFMFIFFVDKFSVFCV